MTSEPWRKVLLDTSPLVAILTPNDSEHHRCVEMLTHISAPLLTTWCVLTEAAWLLKHDAAAVRRLLASAERREITLVELTDQDLYEIGHLYEVYEELHPQLADLSLLRLAERESLDTVFTLDRRDFRAFRLKGHKPLRLLPDDS